MLINKGRGYFNSILITPYFIAKENSILDATF